MNQLEAPAQDPREHLSTVAESLNDVVPPPAPSSMVKGMKRHDGPEVDHDELSQQEQGDYSVNQRGPNGSLDDCEPMINYDGFESVGTFDMAARPCFQLADHEDDVVNVRSPIICKQSSSHSRRSALSPTCVSALARDEVKTDGVHMPSWTIQEFQEYLSMLELLQDTCSNSESEELCLSADSLGQMERLLTSLLPQGV